METRVVDHDLSNPLVDPDGSRTEPATTADDVDEDQDEPDEDEDQDEPDEAKLNQWRAEQVDEVLSELKPILEEDPEAFWGAVVELARESRPPSIGRLASTYAMLVGELAGVLAHGYQTDEDAEENEDEGEDEDD